MKDSDLFLKTERIHKSHRPIIVGFDPGLTVGIAILDLQGNLISLESFKEIRRSEIVSHIIEYGITVLVATDVYPPPKTVRKLASTLNSKIWSPYRSMSVESKIDIVDSFLQDTNRDSIQEIPQNAHERDALAAAVKTYRDHLNKFRQIEKRSEKSELSPYEVESVKTRVINGTSISNAIEQIFQDRKNTDSDYLNIQKTDKSKIEKKNLSKPGIKSKSFEESDIDEHILEVSDREENKKLNSDTVSKLKNKLKSQKRYIDNLKRKNLLLEDENRNYQEEISKLQSKVDKLHYEYTKKILQKRELASKIAMIKRLQEKYSSERAKRSQLEQKLKSKKDIKALEISENAVPVKIIESFTKEGIKEASDRWKIKGDDVVLLKISEGGGSQTASMITNLGVRAVITMDKISDPAENIFEESMVPVISASSVEMNYMHDFAIVNYKTLEREIEKWTKHVKNQRKKEDKKKLLELVDEYRAQRRRSIDK